MEKSSRKKYLILTVAFIPIIAITGELLSAGLIKVKNIIRENNNTLLIQHTETLKVKHKKTADYITGLTRYKVSEKDLTNKNGFIDRHGLIKTSHTSSSKNQKDIKGILVTGSSTATGYPMVKMGEYQNSFVNILEGNLREKDSSVDVLNISHNGYNSWQEFVETKRYFNTQQDFDDLPSSIKVIASLGGIQDFWGFLDLLYYYKKNIDNQYYKANGLMAYRVDGYQQSGNTFNKSFEALEGNIKSGFDIFLSSLVNSIRENSKMYRGYKYLTKKLRKSPDQTTSIKYMNLSEIIKEKIGTSLEKYKEKKELAIDSVISNIKLMTLNKSGAKVIYVYLPTRFGFTENQNNIENRFVYRNKLNARDLSLLEKDYRESLIRKMNNIDGINAFYSDENVKDSWFYDESHYSRLGHKNIAIMLEKYFIEALQI